MYNCMVSYMSISLSLVFFVLLSLSVGPVKKISSFEYLQSIMNEGIKVYPPL